MSRWERIRARATRRALVVSGCLLVAALVAVTVLIWRPWVSSPLRDAAAVVPKSTLRLAFTDWRDVRDRLDPGQLKSGAQISRFMDRAYDADLSAASSINESAAALQKNFGFSPANAEWEAYAQSRSGATMVLKMPSGTDFDGIESRLRSLGFTKPADSAGVWNGGVDLVSGIDPTITPELQYVVVLADEGLIVTSDTRGYAKTAGAVAAGDADSLLDRDGVGDLIEAGAEPAAAFLWSGDFACEDLAMSQADDNDQAKADQAIAAAGGVSPVDGLLLSMGSDRHLDVVLGFEDSARAEENLRPRAKLAVGPAIGKSGDYPDDVVLKRSRTSGSEVILSFAPANPSGFVISNVNSGPVLFAGC